jgi:hypothetical protein
MLALTLGDRLGETLALTLGLLDAETLALDDGDRLGEPDIE